MERVRLPWVSLGLLLACFLLALCPRGPEVSTAGQARVELSEEPMLVALTFDDGPRGDTTGKLLEGLRLREVCATFFLIGEQVEGNEALVRQMAADGHQVGIHTEHHVMLKGVDEETCRSETMPVREKLTALLGPGDYWLRPPYGIFDEQLQNWAETPLVLWSVDPEDWKDRDRARIVTAVLSQAGDGDIILMHDIYDSSVEAALEIVDELQNRGAQFVTVEQLLKLRGVEPEPGLRLTKVPGKD